MPITEQELNFLMMNKITKFWVELVKQKILKSFFLLSINKIFLLEAASFISLSATQKKPIKMILLWTFLNIWVYHNKTEYVFMP